MNTVKLRLVAFSCILSISLSAQTHPLKIEVGDTMPDIALKNIKYYSESNPTINSFRGKWLVLDFWHKYCKGCILTMPKTNEEQREFGDRVQFILIGREDPENKIRTVYEKYREKFGLELPVVFDSSLHHLLGVGACPHIFVIDPNGIVRAITFSLDAADIKTFLAGGLPVLGKMDDDFVYDESKPLLVDNNGGIDSIFMFRSLLTKYITGTSYYTLPSITHAIKYYSKFEALCVNLVELYRYAYLDIYKLNPYDSLYGKISLLPILELKDSSDFICNSNNGKNYFNYSLICPKSKTTTTGMQQIMQRDLMNYFGYKVSIENRMMPCWKITASKKAKIALKTKGGETSFKATESESTGFTVRNYPSKVIASHIWVFHQMDIPFIDETGIDWNIDFTMDAIFADLDSIRSALQKQGLDLIKGQKMMRVLVIKDR